MDLDDFETTEHGLLLRGASPDMLDDLLGRYTAMQRAAGFDPDVQLLPGLSRGEIVDSWASLGVSVPEEAIRLWQWHNGPRPLGKWYGVKQMSLSEALDRYDSEDKGFAEWEWHPAWIPFWSDVVMSTGTEGPPAVRMGDGGQGADFWDQRVQALSVCTMIALPLYGFEHGLFTFGDDGIPRTQRSVWPPELEISKVYRW